MLRKSVCFIVNALEIKRKCGIIGVRTGVKRQLRPGPKRTRSKRGIMSPDLYIITAIRPFSPKQTEIVLLRLERA
jgi:hypothetical protein